METVLVQLVGMPVRGRDNRDATLEKRREEPGQDHRVGNVANLHFVETHHAAARREPIGGGGNRIGRAGLARRMDRILRHHHEIVKMQPERMDRVVPRQKRAMKHVHQHRLATTNTAMDIESGDVTFREERRASQPRAGGAVR